MTARTTAALLLAGLLWPGLATTVAAAEPEPSRAMLGRKIPNLTWETESGRKIALHDLKDRKAIVIVFLSFDCPVSCSYSEPLAEVHRKFHDCGVTVIGLTTDDNQSRREVADLARKYGIPFPVVPDYDLQAADALQADYTPEVFVLDGGYTLRYRGRIDNAYYARLKRNHEVTAHDLHQALGELLSGRPVSAEATLPVGCRIYRELKVAEGGPVTYYRDVLPILQNRCQGCHRPGEVGPFSLMTYRQAVNWAEDIKGFTQDGTMPPWKPVAGLPFHNDRRLPKGEIDTLAKWVETGTPKGDPGDAPPPAKFTDGWQLGEPDLVLEVPADFQLGPTGHDVFRCFALPTGLAEDKYVAAVEVRPGDPSVVHHALLFVDGTGAGRKLQDKEQELDGKGQTSHHAAFLTDQDKGPGYSVAMGVGFRAQGGLGGWAPGSRARYLHDGHGYYLPKGADVLLQVHYHRSGRQAKDRTRVGLYFAKDPNTRPIQGHVISGGAFALGPVRLFSIPAGAENFQLTGSLYATDDCTLYTINPHMHLLGKEIKVTMTPPEGEKVTLIHIKHWDYNWQEAYEFATPLQVKKGTRLDVEAYYDNSEKNPNNPSSPPKGVAFGEQTTDEMCFVFIAGSSERRGRQLPFTWNPPTAAKADGGQ